MAPYGAMIRGIPPKEMMDTPIGIKLSVLAFAVALIGTAMAGFGQSAGALVKSAIKGISLTGMPAGADRIRNARFNIYAFGRERPSCTRSSSRGGMA